MGVQPLRRFAPAPLNRGALGRPGQPCCALELNRAQSAGPCPNGQQLRNHALTRGAGYAAVNLNSGARLFPETKNLARPARPKPTRQWPSSLCRYSRHLPPAGGSLSYQGSCRAVGETERLYYMPLHAGRKPFLRATSPSPSVTPLLVGEALALRKLHLFAMTERLYGVKLYNW